jgi:hypothetical protein
MGPLMLRAPFLKFFQRRADQVFNDSSTDDALALNEPAIARSARSFLRYPPPADLSSSFQDGARTSRSRLGNAGAAFTPLNLETEPKAVVIAEGATAEIKGPGTQSVTFTGKTGTLEIDHSLAFTGQISGLAGSDAIDLADVSFGASTQATYLGNSSGGALTVSDGTHTANIALQGDYLSSSWTLSSDGHGGTTVVDPVSTNTWQALPIGAGGFLSGMSIAHDNTMVVRTDTYGAYIWNGNQWQQLVTAASMPAAFVANAQLYNYGVFDIQVASSNSSVMYMVYPVDAKTYPPLVGVYKSTDRGATWTQTSFAPLSETTLSQGPYRTWGQKMAIDPTNPNVVYFGTGANGLFVTKDGGNTWSSVSGVPAASPDGSGNYPGITGILFDPGNTNNIFAASNGNGVYESTNGGASWSKLSGGPSNVRLAAISSNGTYFAIDASNNLWVDTNGTWTEPLVSSGIGVAGVAVDPFNPSHVVVTQYSGQLNESFNSGNSWSGWSDNTWGKPNLVANDIPYQAVFGTDANGLAFDQVIPGKLYINGDRSFWTTTLSGNITTSTVPTWTDQGIGIEQLVANEILLSPVANSRPLAASWDTALIAPNGSTYASSFGPVQDANVVAGWSIDYASSNPNFIVLLADGGYAGGPQRSSYSTDDGQTWTPLPSIPPGGSFGGNIAASTPNNIIFAGAGNQPYYTLDGGNSWNPITLPGVSSWSNFVGAFSDTRVITADRVLSNTFYLLDRGVGIFKTTNGGVSWTLVNTSVNTLAPSYVLGSPKLESTPGQAGDLWLATGPTGNAGDQGRYGSLLHSTDGGSTWTAISNVTEPYAIGFGAPAPGQSYPSIYMAGWVNSVYGVWQSINDAQSWTQIGTWPNGSLDQIKTISGDPNVFGKVYVGFAGSGYAVLSAADTTMTTTAVTDITRIAVTDQVPMLTSPSVRRNQSATDPSVVPSNITISRVEIEPSAALPDATDRSGVLLHRQLPSLTIAQPPRVWDRIANYLNAADGFVAGATTRKDMVKAPDMTVGHSARNLSESSEHGGILLFGQYAAAGFESNSGRIAGPIVGPTTPDINRGDEMGLISHNLTSPQLTIAHRE